MSEHEPSRGAWISDHPHPRPAQRGLTAVLAALGMAGVLIAGTGVLALSAIYRLPLMPLMVIFLLALFPALLLLTVLHPRVTVYERGLWVKPLLWPGCWVAWDAISRIADHTLIRRGTTKAHQKEQFGQLIVVRRGLSIPFLAVGIMGGLGRVRAFGISTLSHREYETLVAAIRSSQDRLNSQETERGTGEP